MNVQDSEKRELGEAIKLLSEQKDWLRAYLERDVPPQGREIAMAELAHITDAIAILERHNKEAK